LKAFKNPRNSRIALQKSAFFKPVWPHFSKDLNRSVDRFTMPPSVFAPNPLNISFYLYCLTAVGNFIFLIVITANAAQTNFAAINRWDQIYHGHNLGAQLCSIITIVMMWKPKAFPRTPALSILHYVGIEGVKLYFAAKWITYWPKPDSADWLQYSVAGLNTTQVWDTDYPTKHPVFVYFTETYDINWTVQYDGLVAPIWNPGPKTPDFLKWVKGRTYDLVATVISLAAVTTALGFVVCALAYLDFLNAKSRPKKSAEVALHSDPLVSQ
jgi:hypothetical protein